MKNISRPTLILDKQKCVRNLRNMQDMASKYNLQLAPHVKTHQSAVIGNWCRKLGISAVTASSLTMAQTFADAGWKEITWAFPVNIREIAAINELAARVTLNLYINNIDSAKFLNKHLTQPVNCFIEIDTGYHRTGINYRSTGEIEQLIQVFFEAEKIRFRGFYTHAGHSYRARKPSEILKVHEDTRQKLLSLKTYFEEKHFSVELGIGDTPCCAVASSFDGIDIIRPGNFVFYDLMQEQIGSCAEKDIAIVLAAPVVEKHPERNELIVHGGAVHLSKDTIIDEQGRIIYGKVVLFEKGGWGKSIPHVYVKAVSQEHGIIHWEGEGMEQIKIGDLIGILPVHSCLTANLMREYITLDGERFT